MEKGQSFFGKIISFFKGLFGANPPITPTVDKGPKTNTIPSSDNTDNSNSSSSSSTNTRGTGDGSSTGTGTDDGAGPDSPKKDEVVLMMGGKKVVLNKSKQYMGVKKRKDVNIPATMMHRSTKPPAVKDETEQLGHFELIESQHNNMDSLETTLDDIRAMDEVSIGTHVFHMEGGNDTPMIPSGEIYVVFEDEAPIDECKALLAKYFLQVNEERGKREYIMSVSPSSPNPIKTSVALQASPLIKIAEPELESPPGLNSVIPTDELFKDQWHLRNTGSHGTWPSNSFVAGADAKVVDAWEVMGGQGSSNVTIAVIDSGFDMHHPDLRGNGSKIIAPWDFESDSPDASPRTGDWHGTACAGVALAAANGRGIVGAAPNARFMPMRFSYISDSQVEKWFAHAVNNGADIISNSWGSRDPNFVMSTRMYNALHKAATQGRNGKGCVIVFASGNTSRNISNGPTPSDFTGFATHPDVISVAASNSRDERSSYSNYGHHIDIAAPSNGSGGAGVLTTDVTGTMMLPSGATGFKGFDEGDYTKGFGGTSSSCPLVAGIAALVLSAKDSLSGAQVKAIIQNTADKVGGVQYNGVGHNIYFGYGRINAKKAVQMALTGSLPTIDEIPVTPPTPPPPPPVVVTPPTPTPTPPPPVTPPVEPVLPPLAPIAIHPTDIIDIPFEGMRGGAIVGAGTEHIYKVSVDKKMVIKLNSPVGDEGHDFDLYLRRGSVPEPKNRNYDKSSVKEGSDEVIELPNPHIGNYFIMVKSYKGSGGYNLEATLEANSTNSIVEALPLRAMKGGILRATDLKEVVYKIGNASKLAVQIDSPVGENNNFDLYVKRGGIPAWNDYDAKGTSAGSEELVELLPNPGDYYILIRSQQGSGGYNLRVTLV